MDLCGIATAFWCGGRLSLGKSLAGALPEGVWDYGRVLEDRYENWYT